MKVFIVFSSQYMEGGEMEAVFSTKERAEAFAATLREKSDIKDDAMASVDVLEFEVDAL